MELPIKPNSNLTSTIQRFFKPFTQPSFKGNDRIIMPLYDVEKILHEHYVSLEPVSITFEYYNNDQDIVQTTILAKVVSTVQADRRIAISDIDSNRSYLLSLEQILTASANVA